jgi:hypothetical protein
MPDSLRFRICSTCVEAGACLSPPIKMIVSAKRKISCSFWTMADLRLTSSTNWLCVVYRLLSHFGVVLLVMCLCFCPSRINYELRAGAIRATVLLVQVCGPVTDWLARTKGRWGCRDQWNQISHHKTITLSMGKVKPLYT